MSNLNPKIKKAIDESNIKEARILLREAFKEADAETFYLASQVALDDEQREDFLREALKLDRFYEEAHEALKKVHTKSSPPDDTNNSMRKGPEKSHPPLPPEANNMAYATVGGEAILRQLPYEDAITVTKISSERTVTLLARDLPAKWLNIAYIGSTGNRLVGWVKADEIQKPMLYQSPARLSDLPVSNYELNRNSEVKKLLSQKKQAFQLYEQIPDQLRKELSRLQRDLRQETSKLNKLQSPETSQLSPGCSRVIFFALLIVLYWIVGFEGLGIVKTFFIALPLTTMVWFLIIKLLFDPSKEQTTEYLVPENKQRAIQEQEALIQKQEIAVQEKEVAIQEKEAEIEQAKLRKKLLSEELEHILACSKTQHEKDMEQRIEELTIVTTIETASALVKQLVPNRQTINYKGNHPASRR